MGSRVSRLLQEPLVALTLTTQVRPEGEPSRSSKAPSLPAVSYGDQVGGGRRGLSLIRIRQPLCELKRGEISKTFGYGPSLKLWLWIWLSNGS